VVFFVVYYIGPILVALTVEPYAYVKEHVVGFSLIVFLLACPVAFWMDRKNNASIRAGDIEAFNERVEELKGKPFEYTHEQAVAAVTRLRDGED
jgi:hypothetical protein